MKPFIPGSLAALLLAAHTFAARPSGPGDFVFSSPSTRGAGLGGAYSAVGSDISVMAYNPAALTRMASQEHSQEFAAHGSLLTQSRTQNMIGYAYRKDGMGTLGLSLVQAGVSGMKGFDALGQSTGDFSHLQLAAQAAWATQVGYRVRYGVGARLLHESLEKESALGWQADAGVLALPFEGSYFSLAAAFQNLLGGQRWSTGRNETPMPRLRLGLADRPLSEWLLVSLEAEGLLGDGGEWIPHAGLEIQAGTDWAFRGGFSPGGPSLGATWNAAGYVFDYAFVWDELNLGSRHQAGISFRL